MQLVTERLLRKIRGYLPEAELPKLTGRYYDCHQVIHFKGQVAGGAWFVSDGFIAAYFLNQYGDREMVCLYQAGDIVIPRSLLSREPGLYEWVAVKDSYLLQVSQLPPDLLKLVLAEHLEREQERRRLLRRPAAAVIRDFYLQHPAFETPGQPLPDRDVAAYLGIAESSLRRERRKLFAPRTFNHA